MTTGNNQQFAAAAQKSGRLQGIKDWLSSAFGIGTGRGDDKTVFNQYGNSNERADRVNHPASEL